MKLEMECKILAGAESKAWLVEFARHVDRLEKLAGNFQASKTAPATEAETADEAEETEEEDFTSAPKKAGRPKGSKNKAKASFDEDDDTEEETETEATEEEAEEESEEESEEEEADPIDVSEMKKGKPKKITVDMVNDACKKLAASKGKAGRAHVLSLLKKHFKTESVSEIDEADYGKALKVLAS